MLNYKLHLIRHGLTESNLKGYFAGQMDIPLCEEGVKEIKDALEVYDYPYVDMVYCSPLQRARQTADLLYPERPLTIVEELKELNMGDFEGRYFKELAEDEAYLKWLEDSINNPPPNATENAGEFTARIYSALHAIFIDMCQNNFREVAVISHGGVVSGLISQFGYPKGMVEQWKTGNIRGFTISMSTQGWLGMGMFEVIDRVGPIMEG